MADMGEESECVVTSERPKDILIAVMGITGSGKSTFISHCTEASVPVGNQLQSHTQDVTSYQYKFAPKGNVYLVDTPGFDDTHRDDTDVLRDIADWLTNVYEKRTDLRGVIYLHRITDTRMQGSARKNLFMFKKLCGPAGLKNVILATTMWENVLEEDGDRREAELRNTPDYWKGMIEKHGSRMVRHENSSDSAKQIIASLLQSTSPTTYAIQNEMVDQRKDLNQTSAGKQLSSIQAEEIERFEKQLANLRKDMAEAKEFQDRESQEQIRKVQEERTQEISKLQIQQEKMKISLERLHAEKHEELKKIIEQMKTDAEASRAEQEKQRQIIDRLTQQLATYSQVRRPSSGSLDIRPGLATPYRDRVPEGIHLTTPSTNSWDTFTKDQREGMRSMTGTGTIITLCSPYYYLKTWKDPCYRVSPEWKEMFEKPNSESQIVHMGPNGSMVRIYDHDSLYSDQLTLFHSSLEKTHPTLYSLFNKGLNMELDTFFVSLGLHGWYCLLTDDGGCDVVGPSELAALDHVRRVWFGYGDSWIADCEDGLHWDLKGHYSSLEAILEYRRGPDDVLHMALDIEKERDWIVVFQLDTWYFDIGSREVREALKRRLDESDFVAGKTYGQVETAQYLDDR